MNKFLVALTLVTAFSAPAFAALEKVPTRPDHRHVESNFKPQWKGEEAKRREVQSRSAGDSYWQPCNTFHGYITNNCD